MRAKAKPVPTTPSTTVAAVAPQPKSLWARPQRPNGAVQSVARASIFDITVIDP
jgi:hypothetical protein